METQEITPDEAYASLIKAYDMLLPWALATVTQLNIPELIGDGRSSADELARKSGADSAALRRLLRYLALRDVLVEGPAGVFGLGSLGEALRKDAAAGAGRLFDPDGFAFRVQMAWSRLPEAIRSGRPGYDMVHGRSFWDDMNSSPELGADFDAKMAVFTSMWIPSVVSARPWGSYRNFVDVGGGNASMAIALLREAPALRGTIVDLPAVANNARANLKQSGVADRCEVVAGSFFDTLPAGADAYLLAQIMHDWPDDQAVRILRRCAEAARPDGHVYVMDRILAEKATDLMHEEANLLMFNMFGATERTSAEFADLTAAADLKITTIEDLAMGISLIDCVPVP
jgi:precorrin-6B methylase 2